MAHVLLCSKDPLLLEMGALVLNAAFITSTMLLSVVEIEQFPPQLKPGLVVLGHSLTVTEQAEAKQIVNRRWPDAKILIFYHAGSRVAALPDCEYIPTMARPNDFVAMAQEILGETSH